MYSPQPRSVLSSLPSPNDVRCQLTTPSHGHQLHPMTQLTSASVSQGPFKPHVIMACVKRLLTVRLRGVGLPTPLLNRAHAYPCLPCPAQPHVAGAYVVHTCRRIGACTNYVRALMQFAVGLLTQHQQLLGRAYHCSWSSMPCSHGCPQAKFHTAFALSPTPVEQSVVT